MVVLKSDAELARMRKAGHVVARTLTAVAAEAKAGASLSALDSLAAELIASLGAKPSFLGYLPSWAPTPFPGVLCLSVNETIVHGIPDDRTLRDGDLLSIDCGAHVDGYHADAALTVGVGGLDALDPEGRRLLETTDAALAAGIAAARPGARLGDISHAVAVVAREGGYGLPAGLGGHSIGTAMHEEPYVAKNESHAKRGMHLRAGLALAIEPMLIESGRSARRTRKDGWTIDTADGSPRPMPNTPSRSRPTGRRFSPCCDSLAPGPRPGVPLSWPRTSMHRKHPVSTVGTLLGLVGVAVLVLAGGVVVSTKLFANHVENAIRGPTCLGDATPSPTGAGAAPTPSPPRSRAPTSPGRSTSSSSGWTPGSPRSTGSRTPTP